MSDPVCGMGTVHPVLPDLFIATRALVTACGLSCSVAICCILLLLLTCASYLYILKVRPLSVISFAKIFSHSVDFFPFFVVSFSVQKLVSLISSHLFISVFISVAVGD